MTAAAAVTALGIVRTVVNLKEAADFCEVHDRGLQVAERMIDRASRSARGIQASLERLADSSHSTDEDEILRALARADRLKLQVDEILKRIVSVD